MKSLQIMAISSALIAALAAGCESAKTPASGDATTSADSTAVDATVGDGTTTDTTASKVDGAAPTDTTSAGDSLNEVLGDAPATAKLATCGAVGQCVADKCAKNAPDCEKPCFADGDGAAVAKAAPLLICFQGQCQQGVCKGSTDPSCNDNCFKSKCLPELFACIDDGKTGAKACDSMKSCMDGCKLGQPDTFACLGKCYNDLDAKSKAAAGTVAACLKKAEGPDPSKACMGEMIGCFVGDKAGTKLCFDILGCFDDCKKANKGDDCNIGCIAQATKAGQKAFSEVIPCFDKSDGPDCPAKFMACAEPSGTTDCLGGIDCLTACKKTSGDSPMCIFSCMHTMTKEGAATLMQLMPCFGKNDPASAKTCGPLFNKCVAPNGTATCAATVGCFQQCPKDDGSCMFKCMKKGTPTAAEQAMTAAMCGQAGDVTKCTAEIGACYGTGTGDCKTVLSCVAGCTPGDGGCFNNCLTTGNPTAAGQAFGAAQCFGASDTSCTGPIVQCIAPIGTKSCGQLLACLEPCGAKTGKDLFACQYTCLFQGSTTSASDFLNFAKCTDKCKVQCKNADSITCVPDCQKASCPKELSACTVAN